MVIWTIKAKRQLRHSLARQLCKHAHRDHGAESCLQPLLDLMQRLEEILTATFPKATNIVVLDELHSFRPRVETHVLLVEVSQVEQGGPYVVKTGPEDKLTEEINGWNCCRPEGLRHDLVFLPLEKRATSRRRGLPTWLSLVYGDAQQFIGVERTISFEEAFLNAVCYGTPSLASIGFVLVELFERLGHLLYATSFVEDPAETAYVIRMPKVVRAMDAWKFDIDLQLIRSDTDFLVNHGASQFIDPVQYFETWILPYFAHERADTNGRLKIIQATESLADTAPAADRSGLDKTKQLVEPRARDLVPYMLRGCTHGDLHGRNILVGLVHGQALWPTVFDYEDMGPCNLLGWDFVKLETELKIRAHWEALSREEPRFIKEVREFEVELNTKTEQHHLDGSWPAVRECDSSRDRLKAVLLELRRMAAMQLGKNRGRAKYWLEEYYFLLAAYGINTANYGNLDRRELVAAYISAGVAAARLSWPRQRETAEREILGV